jgi:hypothetical protein
MGIPERTVPQRMIALEKANAVRSRQAWERKVLKMLGTMDDRSLLLDRLLEVIREPEFWAQNWKVESFLRNIPRWAKTRIDTCLLRCSISHAKTLGGLTLRQREVLGRYIEATWMKAGR